jgi:hypothetical protein
VFDLGPDSFSGNEVYGSTREALDFWYVRFGDVVIEDFTTWHVSSAGLRGHYSAGVTKLDGFTALFDPARAGTYYQTTGLAIDTNVMASNVEISGAIVGIAHKPLPRTVTKGVVNASRYEHLKLDNQTDFSTLGGKNPGSLLEVIDVAFGGDIGLQMNEIFTKSRTQFSSERVLVQFAGDSKIYRAWYDAQRGDAIVPQARYDANGRLLAEGAPRPDMTNDEVFAEIGKAVGGEIMDEDAIQLGGHQAWFSQVE